MSPGYPGLFSPPDRFFRPKPGGAGYMTHAALDHALEVKDWQLSRAVVFCGNNVRKEGKISYLPWNMVMFPNGRTAEISRIDISGDIARLNAICRHERSS